MWPPIEQRQAQDKASCQRWICSRFGMALTSFYFRPFSEERRKVRAISPLFYTRRFTYDSSLQSHQFEHQFVRADLSVRTGRMKPNQKRFLFMVRLTPPIRRVLWMIYYHESHRTDPSLHRLNKQQPGEGELSACTPISYNEQIWSNYSSRSKKTKKSRKSRLVVSVHVDISWWSATETTLIPVYHTPPPPKKTFSQLRNPQ